MTSTKLHMGIDLGGTKTEAIVMTSDGSIVDRWRVESPRDSYDATAQLLCQLVSEAETRIAPIASLGIGIPGCISPATGLVKNANSTWLIGHPLQADLETTLQRAVAIGNDADCFALSEARDGAGAGALTVWGIILGTGTGSGIVIHNQILSGPNAIAGEWGHNPLPGMTEEDTPQPACYCGRTGCIETYLSGPGMSRDHYEHYGQQLTAQEIVRIAQNNNPQARATLNRYLDRLARATASVINIIDPEIIVIGGGLSNISEIYSVLPTLWPSYVFSDTVKTRLAPPCHGDSSGVRGAAWLGANSMLTR